MVTCVIESGPKWTSFVSRRRPGLAIYHLTTKLIRRSQGQSAVAAAAYRAGDELWDEQLQKLFDYSRRHGVDQADIVLPSLAQHEWAKDRETLWNAAEHAGRHPRAQV